MQEVASTVIQVTRKKFLGASNGLLTPRSVGYWTHICISKCLMHVAPKCHLPKWVNDWFSQTLSCD